jgi:Glycoside hydrolase family 44
MKNRRVPLAIAVLASLLAAVLGFSWVMDHPGLAGGLQHHVQALPDPAWDTFGEPQLGAVQVRLDTEAAGRSISPLIYGVAAADAATVRALGATVDRWGGNPSSRYNWVNGHAWNAGRDWEFRNVNYSGAGGSAADASVAATLATGARPLLTVPTLGWVAKDDANGTRSTGVPPTGGPPLSAGGSAITGYDPSANRQLTSVPSYARQPAAPAPGAVYQDQWVRHLGDRFGVGPQGVQLFAMDNEPDLWSTTHTDVHPARMSYDDMLANFRDYATAVKAVAPQAQVLGPDVSGWVSYLYSDLDRGADNFVTHADRRAHGDQEFLPWWLGQVHRADLAAGQRTLDYLDVHYYPQAANVAMSRNADPDTQALRIRSTRSLWDPNYQDESWIGTPVMLVPRLRRWIDEQYPGTKLAITEYNWGGEQDASGAVALAMVLGIFGREGVDLASYWTFPPPDSPAGAAFRLYRNVDGHGATFGDRSLPASSSSPAVAAFASRHSDSGELDVVLANQSRAGEATVQLRGISGDYSAARFCVPAGTGRIERTDMPDPATAVKLPPLTVCTVRLTPR